MLQQNNNNNHPCLDMTHRELLHECRRSSVSFTSALEFGAIPLIKGLRAWAVSGGYSKARRKAATAPRAQGTCQQPADPNRAGLRGWSGQVRGGYGQALESTSSAARTPGVRQGGLGALVTVATLKGTEGGGRQTQTRCLFLKAQGRGSYLCAVESRGAGARVAGPRTHAVILEGAKEEARCSSKGTRPSHDGTDDGGMFKVKPRAIRKWRKCSKTTGSAEKRSQGKGETAHPRREPGHKAERNSEMSEPTTQTVSLTSDNAIPDRITPRHIEKNKTKASNASSPSSIKPQSSEDVTEFHEDERALSPRSVYVVVVPESTDPQTSCSSAKLCANTEEQVEACMSISPSNNCSKDDLANKGSYYASDDAQGDTEVINCENDLDANERQNIKTKNKNRNFADVPNLRESFEVSKVQSTSEDLEIKPTITDCNTEPSVVYPPLKTSFEVPVNNIQENQDQEPRTGECLLNCENSEEIDHLKTQRGETPDTQIIVGLESYIGQSHTSVGVQRNTTEKKPPQHCEELITEYENLEVQQSDKSSSRGFGSPTANVTVNTIHSLPNPAPTTTATMATNIPAPSKGEVGVGGGDSLPLMNLELLSEPERVDNRDKVATDERSLNAGVEEEEDEFGAFMQAGGEQLWKNEFQQLATGEDYSSGQLTSSTNDAIEPVPWTSDWTAVQNFQQSESTWIAFSQDTVEQEIACGDQWWPSTVEKPNPSRSPHHDVSSVFLEAFPSEKLSCEDPAYIPTLQQFLQGPAEKDNTEEHREQSLLDGLQDLDRMIGVKYKRAESLSCKLLLQSLHLERPSSEHVTVQLKTNARFSPNLPTSNQQLAANAKRRLSYDFNRNIMT